MAFFGSNFTNETAYSGLTRGHARHIACPRRLKYIHDIKDGYIPYVEDWGYLDRPSHRNVLPRANRFGLYNTTDVWRKELMGLAQQAQSTVLPFEESRSPQRRLTRSSSAMNISHSEENSEQNPFKRLLNRRASPRYSHSSIPRPRIGTDGNEQTPSTINKNQDAGIWLLPTLCYILQLDNIHDAQEWLVNANPTEKRLAMELINRTMEDMQIHENDYPSDLSIASQSSSLNNLYWPYKFWQHHHQLKLSIDNNDTCERATSPVRVLTPAKRLSVTSISSRSNQSAIDSRLATPMSTSNDRSSRSSHRTITSPDTSNMKSVSANSRGKTPLI